MPDKVPEMTDDSPPPVTLIIPNYNGAHLLRRNLPYVVEAARQYPGETSVIVVDDGSGDDSVAVLENEFPSVRLVRHAANRGFSEAIRSGVEAAETELLIFLNTDVRPDGGFIAPLLRHFEKPNIFSVAPLVMDENLRAREVSWRCYRIRYGRLRGLPWRYDETKRKVQASLFASGGSMALRKSMFLALGGFLPIFKPFYSEDADLGIRAWRRGWPTLFEPESLVIHGRKGAIAENVTPRQIRRIRERNRFLLEWIHLPARDLVLFVIPRYILRLFGRLLKFDLVAVSAWFSALWKLPKAMSIRREVANSAALGFWEIMKAIEQDAKGTERETPQVSG